MFQEGPYRDEFIEAVTMIPPLLAHALYVNDMGLQAWLGIVHSLVSFCMHFNISWQQCGHWPPWTLELYTIDKCLIMVLAWYMHFMFEPITALPMALPCVADLSAIVVNQQHYCDTKYAYFDVFLLCYAFYVYSLTVSYRNDLVEIYAASGAMLMGMVGYGMEIHGLMHLALTPMICMCYEFLLKKNNQRTIKNSDAL